ncbi:MAG: glycosyltransferase family 2 protein [Solirubrobacteraceae bacterium]|jgi:GT2 family glycosyltransferase
MWERGVDVVIPIHGGRALTERCLTALAQQTLAHRVIVVDNASPDDSVTALRERFPNVTVLTLHTNRGYAAACNTGLAHGTGEAVVLLNNDVVIPPRFLERLLAPMDADTHIGSVAAVLLRPGESVIDSAGLAADPTLAGFPRLQGQPERSATTRHPTLLGPAGAAGAYRRAALAEVGGLDERIFLYQEDLDLALRLCAAGWSSIVAHDARAVHLGSATAGRGSSLQRRHAAVARGYLLRRYGIMRGRRAVRALATEALVVAGDAALSHDLAALRGRLAGWRAARQIVQRTAPGDGLDPTIGFLSSMRLRRADRSIAVASTPSGSLGLDNCGMLATKS